MFSMIWTVATWIVSAVIVLSLVSVGFGVLFVALCKMQDAAYARREAAQAKRAAKAERAAQARAARSPLANRVRDVLFNPMPWSAWWAVPVVYLIILGVAHAGELDTVQICRVIDGDTVVTCAGEHLRLKGICTAELREPGGRAAQRALIDLIDSARTVIIERFAEREKYGRTLARLWIDGAPLEQDQLGPIAGRGQRYCRAGKTI